MSTSSDNSKTIPNSVEDIPVFAPPSNQDIPVFSAPDESNLPHCHNHPTEVAVAECARCGKPICRECAEAFGVSAGEYEGEYLCYDCCRELVKQNVAELKRNKRVIIRHFILTIIGMGLGLFFALSVDDKSLNNAGISRGVLVFFSIFIGGVFFTFLKSVLYEFKLFGQAVQGDDVSLIFGGMRFVIVAFLWLPIKSVYLTIRKIISYISYLIRTSSIIVSDSNAIRQMEEFMEYSRVRFQNKEADLESLIQNNSSLSSNSFVNALRNNGESTADSMIRQATMTISENGEIVRSFVA